LARALTISLPRDKAPARADLQKALDVLGFRMKLGEEYAPLKTSGYLPCDLDGEDAGFDLRFKDDALICKWGGDPREEAAACLFAAALVRDFGAVAQRGEAEVSLDALIAAAKKALA
jgi:hypothetical protein